MASNWWQGCTIIIYLFFVLFVEQENVFIFVWTEHLNIVNKNDCRQHVENSAENRNQTKQKVDKLKQYFCLFCVCLGFGVSINGISVLIFLRPTLQNNETIPAIHIQTKQKMINFVSVFCLFIDAFSNGIPPNEKRLKFLFFWLRFTLHNNDTIPENVTCTERFWRPPR